MPEKNMKPVWIVDDDKSIRWVLEKTLSREQTPFKSFTSATEALAQLDAGTEPPQVLDTEPESTAWQRVQARVFRWLPVESQL